MACRQRPLWRNWVCPNSPLKSETESWRRAEILQLSIIGYQLMSVLIKPIGMLKDYIGGQSQIIIPAGCTVRESLNQLGIPPDLVALIVVLDKPQPKDYILRDEDVVTLLAVIGGG
jgi:sulfur carrier protein ThiS